MCNHTKYLLICRDCRHTARMYTADSLPIPKAKTYDGYYIDNVLQYLEDTYNKETSLKFSKFIMGQTGGWEDDKMVVYSWDVSRFLNTL